LNAVKGPPEKIIEDVKRNIDVGAGPGYHLMLNFCDYWSVPEYIDLTIKTAKEYGAEVYKKLGK